MDLFLALAPLCWLIPGVVATVVVRKRGAGPWSAAFLGGSLAAELSFCLGGTGSFQMTCFAVGFVVLFFMTDLRAQVRRHLARASGASAQAAGARVMARPVSHPSIRDAAASAGASGAVPDSSPEPRRRARFFADEDGMAEKVILPERRVQPGDARAGRSTGRAPARSPGRFQ